jgi:hypothetical protein
MIAAAASFAVAAALSHAVRADATTTPVDPSTLASALINSSAGDTLVLAPGNYTPSATLEVAHNVTLVGPASGAGAAISGGSVKTGGSVSGANNTIDVDPGVTLTLENVTLTGGLSSSNGASAALDVFGTLDMENAAAEGNSNIVIKVEPTGVATIRNSTIANNNFSDSAVAVDVGGDAMLFNVTIDHNDEGVFMDGGTAELTNTIVANSVAKTTTNNANCPGGVVTKSTNSFDTDGSCGLDLPSANPLLNAPTRVANGSTDSELPQISPVKSPAIDAGTNSPCPASDQNGSPRNDGHCDIGAVEVQQGGGTGDTTPPVVTVPADMVVEATGPNGAAVTFTVTAQDNVDGAVTATCDHASGSTFPLGRTTVTCSATDKAGNIGTASFHVTVQDTTPPAIAAQADITAEATSASGATVSYTTPGATDAVDGSDPVSCAPASGAVFALGTTPVTCSATDTHGNTGHSSFNVTVADTTAPAITVPGDMTAEATGAGGAVVTYSASASDLVDPSPTFGCSPASASMFPLGTTTVNCAATDHTGNTSSKSFTVTVQDTTPPAITVPADITAEATGPSGAVVTYSASASDLVDPSPTFGCLPASASTFPLGATTVDCTATDHSGNTSTKSFKVTVQDTTPPAVHVPGDLTVAATGAGGANVTYTVTFTDAVGVTTSTCTPASGSLFPIGTTAVHCSASDAAGNTGQGSFNVTVTNASGPVISNVPADITAEATSPAGAQVSYTNPTATDVVDGTDPVTCSPQSGSTFALATTTVDCSATDTGGLTAHASFHVTVADTTPPVVASHSDVSVEATAPSTPVNYTAPTATDVVDGTDPVSCVPGSGSGFPVGSTAVDCSSTDAHGNTGHSSFHVIVADTTPPTITAPGDITAEATGPGGAHVDYSVTFADAVGVATASCLPATGSLFGLGTTTVDCTAADAAGNMRSASFHVTVEDTTPPTFANVPSDITATAPTSAGTAVTYTAPTASDLVDGTVPVGCSPASGSLFPLGPTTVDCSAQDSHGNTGHATFRVTVTLGSGTPPTIHATPADITSEATGPSGAVVTYPLPTATDPVDGTDPVQCVPASGSTFPLGATTVTCTATDTAGLSSHTMFHVTVQDATPPVVTVPTNQVVVSTTPRVVTYSTSASDLVSGSLTPSCSPASGSAFPLGMTTVACHATDTAGNTGTASFEVTVALALASGSPAAGGTVSTGNTPTPAVPLETSVTTPNAGPVTIVEEAASGQPPSGFGFLGFEAMITAPPATAASPLVLEFLLDASLLPAGVDSSNVVVWRDGATVPPCTGAGATPDPCIATRSPFPLPSGGGADIVVRSSHASSWNFGFSLTATPPVVTVPANIVVEIKGPPRTVVTYTATAVDSLGSSLTPICVPPSGSVFRLGTTTVTCTATDAQGSSSSASFQVTVLRRHKSQCELRSHSIFPRGKGHGHCEGGDEDGGHGSASSHRDHD